MCPYLGVIWNRSCLFWFYMVCNSTIKKNLQVTSPPLYLCAITPHQYWNNSVACYSNNTCALSSRQDPNLPTLSWHSGSGLQRCIIASTGWRTSILLLGWQTPVVIKHQHKSQIISIINLENGRRCQNGGLVANPSKTAALFLNQKGEKDQNISINIGNLQAHQENKC